MEANTISSKFQIFLPSFKGAKELICRINKADSNIDTAKTNQYPTISFKSDIPYESIAYIAMKYGNRDIYRDVYKFIR